MRLSLFLYGTGRGSRSSLCVLVIIVIVFPGCELNVDYVLVHVDLVVVAISSHYKRRRNCPFDPIDPALLDVKEGSNRWRASPVPGNIFFRPLKITTAISNLLYVCICLHRICWFNALFWFKKNAIATCFLWWFIMIKSNFDEYKKEILILDRCKLKSLSILLNSDASLRSSW